jgi:Protein of unknown function (DUF1059)
LTPAFPWEDRHRDWKENAYGPDDGRLPPLAQRDGCSLVIVGEEDELVQAAAEHAASVHGHENNEELRAQLNGFLEPADQ